MKGTAELLAFNRGVVSRLALARLDLKRLALSAEIQSNWIPRALGSMMLRPGFGFIGAMLGATKMIPFVFAADDTADIEMSDSIMRVRVNGTLLTRPTVSAAVTNGNFDANVTSWTDQDEAGGVSAWVAGGYMGLTGDGTNHAIREQAIAIGAYSGVSHAIRVTVQRGPVVMRIGSSSLGSQYLNDTTLGTGTHSITITPTGTFYLQFRNRLNRQVLVDSVSIESGVALSLPTPYGASDLRLLRWDQSGDVIYIACSGKQQRKIERRSNGSWSFVTYQPEDGPFRVENVSPTTLTASGLSSNITVTASASLFRSGHLGALFSHTSVGQRVEMSFTTDNTFSDPIRVAGVGESRRFSISVSGTFVATVTLQRSVGQLGSWEDVGSTITTPTDTTYNDALDNQIIYYRLAVKSGDYTSGTVVTLVNYSSGSITGVFRVTAYTSDVLVSAEVLNALGGTSATDIWAEGQWSDYRGWPSAVALHDGRLGWAGKDRFVLSITDAFESFDPSFEGDAGVISRSIGSGPVDTINWLVSLNRLLAGTDGSVAECKSSSLDEPLTPTNFTPKIPSTKGCARVGAVKLDDSAMLVQRSGIRLLQLEYPNGAAGSPVLTDLTILSPEVCEAGIVSIAIQREPDTRVHCVLSDGTVAVLVFDAGENLRCWVKVETDGEVQDVSVQPGTGNEDRVEYIVKRTIGGVDVYYREQWALESEARGGTSNKQADSFVYYSGVATAAITGLGHLEGEEVIAWADGIDYSPGTGANQTTYTVSGGQITLPDSVTTACVGLPYAAQFKSTKLAYIAAPGKSALGAKKIIDTLGLVLADTHAKGIQYGPDFDTLDDMPEMEAYAEVGADTVHADYEAPPFEFSGEWTTDARVCLQANAPRPCTVLGAIIDMESHSK